MRSGPASALEVLAAWATIVVLLVGLLGASWRAGSTLRGIRDDLRDHGRRLDDLEDWQQRQMVGARRR